MKVAGLILGLIGGVAGIFGSIFAFGVSGVGTVVGAEGAGSLVGNGIAALIASLLGIVGGALAIAKPKIAGIFMLVAGVGGFIAVFVGYAVAAPLLIIGGILALVASKKQPTKTTEMATKN